MNIKVLAGLDLSEMDREMIHYMALLQQWLPPAHVTFLHNIKVTELPREMREPAKLQNIAARIEKKFRELIMEIHTPAASFDIAVTIEEFSELAFMNVVKRQKTDLVLLGNKQTLEGNGGLSQKLARMLPAAVLLIPENVKQPPAHIIQAIDFSRYTPAVLRWGRIISTSPHHPRFSPVHIIKMGYHFFPAFSDEEVEDTLRNEGADKLRKWKEQHPGEWPLKIVPAYDRSVASTLLDVAASSRADLIILGVKGASSLTNLFMGSVANEMLQREKVPALLLVKP